MNPLSSKFWFKKLSVDSQNTCSNIFGEEDICYCPLALPLACPPSQDLTSKSCISQAPLPIGFWLDFVREITLGDRKFGEGGDKIYCHFFSSWGLISSHVVILPLWS